MSEFYIPATLRAAGFAAERLMLVCHGESRAAGWYHDPKTGERKEINVGERLMLIVSEIAEAMEGHRKNLPDSHLPHLPSVAVELADAMIRIGDLAGFLGVDIGRAVAEKLAYNRVRADHKPEARMAPGGKAY